MNDQGHLPVRMKYKRHFMRKGTFVSCGLFSFKHAHTSRSAGSDVPSLGLKLPLVLVIM